MTARTVRAPRAGGGPALAGVVVGVGLGLWAWIWLSGQITGLLVTGRWPAVPWAAASSVAGRLPAHLTDPPAAWPSPVRSALPVSALFAVAAALVVVGVVVGGAALTAARWTPAAGPAERWRHGAGSGPSRRRVGGARWATTRDLRRLAVAGPGPGRVILGRAGRVTVATEARHSVLVLGPTQSGKTSGLAVPAILQWDGPVVATSVKADLAGATAGWRSRLGRCWVFDPTATSAMPGRGGWSPLCEAGDWSGAQRVASWMVEATPARSGMNDGAFWYAAAAKQLAPMLLAARSGGLGMAEVVAWTDADQWDRPLALLESAGHETAAAALVACAEREDRIRSSVATTLSTVLSPFEDPVVVEATAGDDIDPHRLLEGTNTLYLCGPTYEQARLQGLFAALVSSVVAAAVERATSVAGPLDPPLLLVLDEAANIAPIRDLDTLASTGAALGIQLVTICQDLAQFTARYGADRARTIANNHRAKVALSGIADLSTLDLLSGLAGEQAVREESVTADLRDGRRTRSTSLSYRRLVPADELRRIEPGHAVLIYGHLPPARLRLRPWFADRQLRRRAQSAPPDP